MKFNKTVLAFHAHPDDMEFFCGGTLTLLKEKGFKIVVATTTNGGIGGILDNEEDTALIRKEEAAKAAEKLDAEFYCLDERDGFLFDNENSRMKAVELIRKVRPGIVMTHLSFDYHIDHRTTSSIVEFATLVATLPNILTESKPLDITPLLYHTEPYNNTDSLGRSVPVPSFIVNTSSVIDFKTEMLTCHESQQKLMQVMFKIDDFTKAMTQMDEKLGHTVGFPHAEAFWQHLGGGFQKDPLIQEALKEFINTGEKYEYN